MAKKYAVVKESLFGTLEIQHIYANKDDAIESCKFYLELERKKPPLERRKYFLLELEEVDSDE